MLAIEVVFLTGRYVATAHNTRTSGEWPPHPARLFSALVATHHAAFEPSHDERQLLEWLERLGAPLIAASSASQRDLVTVFVPVNDVGMTDVDDEASQRDAARDALAVAVASGDAKLVKKGEAATKKAEATFAKAVARATGVSGKLPNSGYGRRVLPEYRTRQPRTLPSMTPDESQVVYTWPEGHPTVEQRALLDDLLRRVVRLGHSSSLVAVRTIDNPSASTWQPSTDGTLALRVFEPGQLVALERTFNQHRELDPRVLPAKDQPYSRVSEASSAATVTSRFSENWLVLRRVDGTLLPMTAAAGLARAVRRTLMSFADDPTAEMLTGHAADGRPSADMHLAVVPLPFVGHQHATGAILGVALVFPREASEVERRTAFLAVERWEQAHRLEDEDTPAVQLNLGGAGEMRLERVEWAAVQTSLRPAAWCSSARVWSSVTPVALDRHPGDLRSCDPQTLDAAVAEAEESIRVACERIGLPRARHVEILPAAPWAGAVKARQYPRYPVEVTRIQRVLTHVRLEFDDAVRGPVILGAGRFAGLGLFKPEAPQ